MKAKTIAVVFAAVMILSLAACNTNNRNTNPNASPNPNAASSLPGGTPGTAGAEHSQPVVIDNSPMPEGSRLDRNAVARRSEFADENVRIDLSFDRESYTVNELIGLNATITNNSQHPIVFEKGSGSNNVPEALRINFGGFVSTYTPLAATADYQLEHLQPGESVTYNLPHAPYTPTAANYMTGTAYEQTIDFFRTDEYTPATAGEVTGELTFTYLVNENGAHEGQFDFQGEQVKTITGRFTTDIVE